MYAHGAIMWTIALPAKVALPDKFTVFVYNLRREH